MRNKSPPLTSDGQLHQKSPLLTWQITPSLPPPLASRCGCAGGNTPSHIAPQFTCQAKADPLVLRYEAADDPWSTAPVLRKPLPRTRQEQGSPIAPEGLHMAPHRTLSLHPCHRIQASGRDHRAQKDRAEGSICSPCRKLGSCGERETPQFLAWASPSPSGLWSACSHSPLSTETSYTLQFWYLWR